MILPDASCLQCADVTGGIEQVLLRTMWGPFRTLAGFPTRRPKERPKTLPIDVEFYDGREGQIWVPAEDYPAMLNLPILPPARALRGLPDNGAVPVDALNWTWADRDALIRVAKAHGAKTVHSTPVDTYRLVRVLAKIAHCKAVADFGVNGFVPLALDLVFGRSQCLNFLVGCRNAQQPPSDEDLHNVGLFTHNEHGIILVEVRLFASLGAPRYHVVVGLKHGGKLARVI